MITKWKRSKFLTTFIAVIRGIFIDFFSKILEQNYPLRICFTFSYFSIFFSSSMNLREHFCFHQFFSIFFSIFPWFFHQIFPRVLIFRPASMSTSVVFKISLIFYLHLFIEESDLLYRQRWEIYSGWGLSVVCSHENRLPKAYMRRIYRLLFSSFTLKLSALAASYYKPRISSFLL